MTETSIFWLGAAIFYAADCYLFTRGHNSFFHHYKTPDEKAAQRMRLGISPNELEAQQQEGGE